MTVCHVQWESFLESRGKNTEKLMAMLTALQTAFVENSEMEDGLNSINFSLLMNSN